jgi:hypothetical protein
MLWRDIDGDGSCTLGRLSVAGIWSRLGSPDDSVFIQLLVACTGKNKQDSACNQRVERGGAHEATVVCHNNIHDLLA